MPRKIKEREDRVSGCPRTTIRYSHRADKENQSQRNKPAGQGHTGVRFAGSLQQREVEMVSSWVSVCVCPALNGCECTTITPFTTCE